MQLYKRILGLFIFTWLILNVTTAQNKLQFDVVELKQDLFDTSAKSKRYGEVDGNGSYYAIIKVTSDDPDDDLNTFRFNFGNLNCKKVLREDALWLYVQKGAKNVTISREGYVQKNVSLGFTIESGANYTMHLTYDKVVKTIQHGLNKQVLQFHVTPSDENATIRVKKDEPDANYELWGTVDANGTKDNIMDFGTYIYEVSAKNYLPTTGKIKVPTGSPDSVLVERVKLTPNFGWLEITDKEGAHGAEVYINNEKVGTIPYKSGRMEVRNDYTVTVIGGELYKTWSKTFSIKRGETTVFAPKLESNFAETTLKVESDVEILVDGKTKGHGTWTGPLKAGQYVVECRKPKHTSTSRRITILPDKSEVIELEAPSPIVGSLYVSSTPSGATISIDGKATSHVTPALIKDVIIGKHSITLTKENYKTESLEVECLEGKNANVVFTLGTIAHMTIDSKPSSSQLFINGESVGVTPYSNDMKSGDYDIELRHAKYKTIKKQIHLDSSNPSTTFVMQKQHQRPYSFYIQPYLQIGSSMAIGGIIGGYIANVNIEGYYSLGLGTSEMIYWNSIDSSDKPCGYSYKANNVGGKIGYGIIFGTRMRLTPQVGLGVAKVASAETYDLAPDFDASKTYAVSASLGVKYECAIANCLGIFVTPEYSFVTKKGEYFNNLSNISNKIKGYASGLNVRVGLSLFF